MSDAYDLAEAVQTAVENLKTAPRVQADVRRELRSALAAFASTRDLEHFEVRE
ncbi:hypothetical protein [Rhizobium sp. Root149]|uniref:hypothetical protein n=1 Tax=Rhizobium sp. Root149 TaxID=1736473 RepID=UPI000ACA28FE|nr:hypothetical protein [Rhizobium sp. Root149]